MATLPADKEQEVIQLIRDFGDTLPGVRSILESVERYRACFRGDHCAIPLSNGGETLVDLQDFWLLPCRLFRNAQGYAQATSRGGSNNLVHRILIIPPKNMFVDHINRNRLDNRRGNLRIATPAQNGMNRNHRPNKTGYIGVAVENRKKYAKFPYYAQIQVNGIRRKTPRFPTPEQAARAYDAMARELHGEFAVLNFPD